MPACRIRRDDDVAGRDRYADRIDGVHVLTHPFSCSQTGRDLEHTLADSPRWTGGRSVTHVIAGGITTLEEKSPGAVQKGGRAPLTAARRYGEREIPLRKAGVTL